MAGPRILTIVMSIDRKSVQINVRLCGQNGYKQLADVNSEVYELDKKSTEL